MKSLFFILISIVIWLPFCFFHIFFPYQMGHPANQLKAFIVLDGLFIHSRVG